MDSWESEVILRTTWMASSASAIPKSARITTGGFRKFMATRGTSMFKFSFNPMIEELVMISFGEARKQRKFAVFDCWSGDFSHLGPTDGIDYWFWSDDPPKILKGDISERELFSV